MSEVAEVLLDSDDYKPYVRYDKRSVLRAVENGSMEQDDLEAGANVTGNIVLESILFNHVVISRHRTIRICS